MRELIQYSTEASALGTVQYSTVQCGSAVVRMCVWIRLDFQCGGKGGEGKQTLDWMHE